MSGGGSDGHSKKSKISKKQDVLTIFAIMTLLIGLGSSFLIYYAADNDEGSVLGYEVVGGEVFPIRPEDSRKYLHDLQAVGGKAYVFIDQFQRWFTGLWHGKSLAFTVAGVAILISAGFFYAANNLPLLSEDNGRGENNAAAPGNQTAKGEKKHQL